MYSSQKYIQMVDGHYTLNPASAGEHYYRFFAQDKSGNVGYCDMDVSVIGEYFLCRIIELVVTNNQTAYKFILTLSQGYFKQ